MLFFTFRCHTGSKFLILGLNIYELLVLSTFLETHSIQRKKKVIVITSKLKN